jgi:hypothetical protein
MTEDPPQQVDLAPDGITIGDLLSTGARAVGQNFLPFLAMTVLVQLPAIAMNIGFEEWLVMRTEQLAAAGYFSPEEQVQFNLVTSVGALVTTLVDTAFLYLTQAVLMFATVEFLAGRKASVGASLRGGLSQMHVVLAVAILDTLAVGLGLLACIIPGVLLMCVLYVSVPAAVVERIGPIAAMQRSADLTTGHRLTIFLVIFLMGVIALSLNCGIDIGFGDRLGTEAASTSLAAPFRFLRYGLSTALACVITMFQAAFASVFYARVRGIRDGVDADAIADVFA